VYSNFEAIQICCSESYESLLEGLETCLWMVGGVPRQHRTDHLSAAIHPLKLRVERRPENATPRCWRTMVSRQPPTSSRDRQVAFWL
jgi:hypothetical protein